MRRAFGRHTEELKDADALEIGPLVQETDLGIDYMMHPDAQTDEISELPEGFAVVAIGRPETKNLASLLEEGDLKKLDCFIRGDMEKYDFYFVRLWCSFQPESGTELKSARFTFVLKPDETRRQPQVYAMYPMGVFDPVKETSRLGFDASLKFIPIFGVTPVLEGTIETGVEYTKLAPKIVTNFNTIQSGVLWDFEKTPVDELRGVRYMYLLAKAPAGSRKLVAMLNLFAKIKKKGVLGDYVFAPWAKGAPTQKIDLLSDIGEVTHLPTLA